MSDIDPGRNAAPVDREIVVDRQIACAEQSPASALPTDDQLTQWVSAVLERHPDEPRGELTIRFVEDDESRELNHTYRDRNKPTNVLSFLFESPPEIDLPLLGDLVICPAVVDSEASEQHKTPVHHYAHMVIHGTLHLLGYDHIEDAQAEVMEQQERDILATLGIPDPYSTEDGGSFPPDDPGH
ncbi:rRNA maturation RNase YbeY [Vreelandella rituensis]|uniref:Endoribonuclease YbeY n=1 Tax=Vreelandella rituensis TaxID=2282306 RepID=A0A368TZZ8_9GAMM|nr:rRNA maturation RNase YbeY [Halomonas rituensis]RCV90334.1 rRNA maturation RNase YbeY [Halomonas rituensis]